MVAGSHPELLGELAKEQRRHAGEDNHQDLGLAAWLTTDDWL